MTIRSPVPKASHTPPATLSPRFRERIVNKQAQNTHPESEPTKRYFTYPD
jgi:hypothetical protein